MNTVEELYKRRLEEARSLDPVEADYHALEQGVYGTDIRHRAVLEAVPLGGSVLDLGCGTGLILDKIAGAGVKPQTYVGVDGMVERQPAVLERLARYGIPGEFRHKPMDIRFEDTTGLPYVTTVLFVGIMGFSGYHTQRHVSSIHSFLTGISLHGCITFPMIWHANQMGDLYLRRWDVTDVQDLLGLDQKDIFVLEREFLIRW